MLNKITNLNPLFFLFYICWFPLANLTGCNDSNKIAAIYFVGWVKTLENRTQAKRQVSKNCNLLTGMSRELIGCNFLFTFLLPYPNKNKRQAIPIPLSATKIGFQI